VSRPLSAASALERTAPVGSVPDAFAALVAEAFAQRRGERFAMLVSGGPLAARCYDACAARPGALDWSAVDLYLGDERMVPADDPDANQRLVRERLIEGVGGVGSFSPMPTDGDPDGCAAAYQGILARLLDGPGIDLIHLGVGPDGHTASLFPGAASLHAADDQLVLATDDPNGVNPHPRLTITLPVIARAGLVAFTVSGTEKRAALARVLGGEDVPAARVRAQDVRWIVDAAALSLRVAGPGGGTEDQ
jgi:6-phosphogluconolactonase